MENLVISHLRLGILGGGQLGKMLALAASHWDIDTRILDIDEEIAGLELVIDASRCLLRDAVANGSAGYF